MKKKHCPKCDMPYATGGPYGRHVLSCGRSGKGLGGAGRPGRSDVRCRVHSDDDRGPAPSARCHVCVREAAGRRGSGAMRISSPATRRAGEWWFYDDGGGVAAFHRGSGAVGGKLKVRGGKSIKLHGPYASRPAAESDARRAGLIMD